MIKWYDRIGNTIEMLVGNGWITGIIVNGERTGDGIVNMETAEGRKYWCGVCSGCYRKTEDSLGDLLTNDDRINTMSAEEKAEWLFEHDRITEKNGRLNKEELLQWLKEEAKE